MPHFLGLHTPAWAMTPKFELGRDFLYDASTPKFHHPMFTRSEVIVLTHKHIHKQIPAKTSNVFCYATTLGNKQLPTAMSECV